MNSKAASFFFEAKKALHAGKFAEAVKHAQMAEALIEVGTCRDRSQPVRPTYSIIVVLYRRHLDIRETLAGLVRDLSSNSFELILINNGDFSEDEMAQYCVRSRFIDVGFNYGCSGGRNVGAKVAHGDFLIFIDDDGVVEDHAIGNLIDVMSRFDAVAVRGRIRPKYDYGVVIPHYDLGDEVVYSVPNTEGFSIWRRADFLAHGGFDTLLAGGEGVALWFRMYASYGSDAFLYAPQAIMRHDYCRSPKHLRKKKAKDTPNDAYFQFAYPQAQERRNEVSLAITRNAALGAPNNAALYGYLGQLFHKVGNFSDAETAYQRALELNPGLTSVYRELSKIFVRQKRVVEAIAAAKRAVACDPENAELHHHLGNLLQWGAKSVEAEKAQRQAIDLKSDLVGAHRQLSVILARADRRLEALAAVRRAIACDPEDPELHYQLGKFMQEWGKLAAAELVYRRALTLRPHYAAAHKQLSLIFTRRKMQGKALAAAERAIECDPENPHLHHNLGRLLQKEKRLKDAETAYRRALELNPNFTRAYQSLSALLLRQGRQEEAVSTAETAIKYAPQNAKLYYNLGKLLQGSQRLKEAEAAFKRAVQLKPKDATIHQTLSSVFAAQMRQHEALAAVREAVNCDPYNANLYVELGKLLQRWEKLGEAELAYKQALAIEPNHAKAKRQLSIIKRAHGLPEAVVQDKGESW